ncbi:hypothetical protein H2O64_03830 [Kordia sp. YSTF-M3]|uniref:Lipocalin-like domain-containing protein n=1 Tax=Kordia aestuariivivens TaxID=2759037 RepID=A0ABR7Q611_9FLAO|nr:hypothetical protein [Kordia aestuariivivens]MBC8753784.1 hypothetical protein [Kordia aestuariivivens]
MKIKSLLCALVILVFFACKTKEKKTDESIENTEIVIESEEVVAEEPTTVLEKVGTIKMDYGIIESLLDTSEKLQAILEEDGGETQLEGYFKNSKPVKIIRTQVSGHWVGKTSYYFMKGKLFFVFQQETSEASLRGPYTDKEVRFYVYDGELIRVLEKEKTVAEIEKMELSKVPNVDVTETWKTKTNVVSGFLKAAKESSTKLLETKKVGLDNGRWISTDDANAGIEIKDGKFSMYYKGTETGAESIFDYELTEHEGVEYLTLKNDTGEELKYSILEYSEDTFIISYLARGNTLTYTKEK